MPSVLIEVRQQYSSDAESQIMMATRSAICNVFKVPPADCNIRLIAHQPHRFECPSDCDKPAYYTHIGIDCFPGRTLETKRRLYRAIVTDLEPFGIPADHVKILVREVGRENWGIRGGQAACDVELKDRS